MAKLSGHVFPESVWKAFGEHVGEEDEEEDESFAFLEEPMCRKVATRAWPSYWLVCFPGFVWKACWEHEGENDCSEAFDLVSLPVLGEAS